MGPVTVSAARTGKWDLSPLFRDHPGKESLHAQGPPVPPARRRARRGRARSRTHPRRSRRTGPAFGRGEGLQVPRDRPDAPERPVRRLRGAGERAAHDLRGDRLGGPVEVGEQRHQLGAHLRRSAGRLDRRHRRGRHRSEHRLGRHGRAHVLAQHLLGRRGLQVGRRGQDVDEHGAQGQPPHRPHRHRPEGPQHRLRGGAGASVFAERRARRVQDDRRRQDLDEVARGQGRWPDGRRGRPRHGSEEPEDPLCRRVRQGTAALDVQPGRPRQRHLQDRRRRQDLDEARRRPARRHAGPHRPGCLREEPAHCLREHREREQAGHVRRRSAEGTARRQVEQRHGRRGSVPVG